MPKQGSQWRMRNIGRQLICATDAFVAEKLRIMEKSGFGPVGRTDLSLIQNLDLGGTRLTLAASRARMTKQSMLELIDRAERLGLVMRRPDPKDGRAKIVAFTPKGLQLMDGLRDGVAEAERQMATIVGSAFMARMKLKMTDYARVKGCLGHSVMIVDAKAAWRTHNIGRVLGAAFGVFTRDVQRTLHEGGFTDVSDAHMTLFRNLDMRGTRPTEIAARARMTKQSMTELVRKTEALRLVEQVPDPADGRAQMVMLTSEGRRLLERTREGVKRAELGMAEIVGVGFLAELKRQLPVYVAAVQSSDYPVVDAGELSC